MVGRNSFPNIHNSLLGSLAAIDSAFTTVHLLLLPWCHHSSLAIIDTQFGDVSSNLRQVSTTHKNRLHVNAHLFRGVSAPATSLSWKMSQSKVHISTPFL